MYNYIREWDQFDKDLRCYKYRYENEQICDDNIITEQMLEIMKDTFEKKYKDLLLLSVGHISFLEYFFTKYGFSYDYTKQWILPRSIVFYLTESRQYEMLDHYIKAIGNVDMFLKLVNHSCYYDIDSVFSYKNLNEIDNKIRDISVFFNVTKRKTIDMVCNAGYLLARPLEKIKEKVVKIAKALFIDITTAKEYCARFPMILDSDVRRIPSTIDKISYTLKINKTKFISAINKYPPLMTRSFTDFNKYYWQSENYEYPFLLNLAPKGRYRINFNKDLFNIIPNIESRFGKIVDAQIRYYNGVPFAYAVVWNKNKEIYYVLGVGDDTKIFSPKDAQVYWPLGFEHEDYYQFGNVRGYFFKCRSVLDNEFDDNLYKMILRRYNDYRPYYRNIDMQKQY